MAANSIVTDEFLKTVLDNSSHAREQAIALLDLVSVTPPFPSPEAQVQISKQQKLLYGYLAQLRGSHRDATFRARDTKALTVEARQEVDRLHLQLQNLLYEQAHLQGEIAACESYEWVSSPLLRFLLPLTRADVKRSSHKYLQLPLIPVEEFLSLHPEHVDDDEIALTIARIEHEHAEREALEQQRQGLLKKKQGLIADNKKRKDDLASLDKQLENFIDVSWHVLVATWEDISRS